ncbi:WD40 repeat domain-containing protein [Streptomyces umbrinus]
MAQARIKHPGRGEAKAGAADHTDTVCAVAISSDGRTPATGSHDRTARSWDITTPRRPRELATLTGRGNHVNTVAFAPGGTVLATGGWDRTKQLWNASDPRHPNRLDTSSALRGGQRRRLQPGRRHPGHHGIRW